MSDEVITIGLIDGIAAIFRALQVRDLSAAPVKAALSNLRSDPAVKEVMKQALPPPHPPLLSPSDSPYPHPLTPPPTTGNYACARVPASRRENQLQPPLFKTKETLKPSIDEIVKSWNQMFSLPRVNTLGKRLILVQTAMEDEFWMENWQEALKRIIKTPFCMGKNDKGWRADFEWFCDPVNVDRLMHGKYDNVTQAETIKTPDYGREDI